jgi:hypothetical protein
MRSHVQLQHVRQDTLRHSNYSRDQELRQLDPLMPNGVTLAEVLGLVEVLGENGFTIPISVGGRSKFFQGSSEFLSLLKAAQMLGLVSKVDNRIFLTDLGLGFLRADFPSKMGILRARLARIEPFKSALEFLSKRNSATTLKISRKLSEKYAIGIFDERLVRLVLIEWGLQTELFRFDSSHEFFANMDQPLQ